MSNPIKQNTLIFPFRFSQLIYFKIYSNILSGFLETFLLTSGLTKNIITEVKNSFSSRPLILLDISGINAITLYVIKLH